MNLKEVLEEDRIQMRLGIPSSLDDLIKVYQANEKKLYNRRTLNKETLVVLMMVEGVDKFIQMSNDLKTKFENKEI